ncbi:hydroxymethylglutaryl-CoA lyase [Hoeflea marina]|uniref:Hydroxymethylglutaryl-CoA lyase n=1 Tax=Hoeflea marina TaxID=274592 RepID=A0A317PIY5_9HYPH|nr:hydroxymethylglutaryl-CoA lyase [Hoeflea marina]PWW00294.1 hydroxymethylglutaryl-CoA lyase [Hoeflea marina]
MSRIAPIYPADRVTLREVGLRDGLQLVKTWPGTGDKAEWLRREHAAGVRHFEVGSFLPAATFPQFCDIEEVIAALAGLEGGHSAALALNERGAAAAFASQVNEIVCVVSATDAHSQANMRRSRAEAVALVRRIVEMRDAAGSGKIINVGLAMALGCSISGAVDPQDVIRLAGECLEAGADIVGIADTIGCAGPRQVGHLAAGMERLFGERPFIVHLHDTRGMGIANAAAALDSGARVLDASLGGLGGCPFAPGATGNVVFEDLVYLCETKGFPTGIDLDGLRRAREIAETSMRGEAFHGALARAGPPGNMPWQARL